MSNTGITCESFSNRIYRCAFFKEKPSYAKVGSSLFNNILRTLASGSSQTLIEAFCSQFSKQTYTGHRSIYKADREYFKIWCAKCAENLDMFLESTTYTNLMEEYNYKFKIRGHIGCVLPSKNINVNFSFNNYDITEKTLDFHGLNNYIYNTVNKSNNDCLVMSVPDNIFFQVKFNQSDYTIKRGFFISSKTNKIRTRGYHCHRCINKCKPMVFNGLKRLGVIL